MQSNSWFKRRRWERQMEAELQSHLENQVADYVSQGLSRDDATLRARREFGALELAKDECRDHKPAAWFDHLLRDLRYAFRSLRRSPGFTFAAIATLALGIGANTSIFQLLDAVRLRTLPVRDPGGLALVDVLDRTGQRGSQTTPFPALTNPVWERFRDHQDAFSGVLAWANNNFGLGGGGEARPARGLFVSGSFFRVLGVQPLLGRVFSDADDHRGCGLPGAVVSYAFWERELGADPAAIGRKLILNFQPVEVIGVTPANFFGVEIGQSYDVAVPICAQSVLWSEGHWLDEGTVWWLTVMGRLKPGMTLEKTSAYLRATSPAIFQATLPPDYPATNVKDYLKFKLTAVPAGTGVSGLRDRYADPLLFLLATAGLVLLIACANIANLILARATAREHEFAVRLAIGASRGRIIQQLMTESVVLALAGATAGFFLSNVLSRALLALLGTQGNPLFLDLQPDMRILVFAVALTCLTCVMFGLLPAFRATRTAPGDAIKRSGRTLSSRPGRFGLRQILVVSQVTLLLVLLVGALLFSSSLRNLLAVDAGFQQSGVLIVNADVSRLKIPPARRVEYKHEMLAKLRALPGVASAAEIGIVPLSGNGISNNVWLEGSDAGGKTESNFNWSGEGSLKTLGMVLLAGRDFSDRDTINSPGVAIVNQSLARQLGLGANPIGKRFRREAVPSEPERVFEIVGLVRDTKYYSLREDFRPIAFLSIDQYAKPDPFPQFVIRSQVGLGDTISMVKSAIAQFSPLIDVDYRPLETMIHDGLLRERLLATLSGFFGVLASLIAAIGLYGVMSYLVVRRTNEIGVRVALGAGRGDILALIMRQAGTLLAIGLAAGTLLSLAVAGTAKTMLFGLKPYDVRTLLLAAALLTTITIVASYLPARRAARLDPLSALRDD